MRNSAGWLAYSLNGMLFVKHAEFDASARYPDFGSNTEIYTDGSMLELETLGPLQQLGPGATAEHRERWSLHRLDLPADEEETEQLVNSLVAGR